MVCNCLTMCRIPDVETEGGKYPMPIHSPNCADFKQKQYVRMESKQLEVSFIVEPGDVASIEEMDGVEYDKADVLLTPDQYENLEEFDGY